MINQVEETEMKPAANMNNVSTSPLGRIIVVDDEPKLKDILVQALSEQGFDVTGCSSGPQALAELQQKEFDLLLTDLIMPEMDGIALIEAALQVDPNLAGIIMTGQDTIQTAIDAMKTGAYDFVLKPFRLQTAMPVLTRALSARRLRMENLQLRETVAIYSLCQTITFTLDPQTVLSKLADAALQQTDADEVSILLPTPDGKELFVAAVRGAKRERLLGELVPLQESISSWVARERTPLILNGEVSDERFVALWPRSDIRSAISIPMEVANKVIGVINLNVTNHPRPFTVGQMKALTILASTAAAALESASLYAQVQTTQEKYQSIFENATEGLFQATPDGQFLTANPKLARILGYDSPEEMIAGITDTAPYLYVHPRDRLEVARLAEERGVLEGFEFEAYRKDGTKIWLSQNRRAVRNQSGQVLYFEGSIEDITASRHVEEEKRKTRQQYESLVHTIDGIVWELDVRTWKFTFVSRQSERILGYKPEQWLRDPDFWKDHLHPDDRSRAIAFSRDATAKRVDHELDYRMIAADGRVIWLRDIVAVDSANLDSPILRGVMMDITQRRLSEEQLKKSGERLRDLVENAHDLIYEHDLEGNFTAINKAGEKITGYTLEETLQLNLTAIVAPEYLEKAQEMLRRKLEGERVTVYDLVVIARDGRRVPVEVNTRLVLRGGVPVGVQGIARDTTERNRSEEALRESEAHKKAILESSMDCIITMDHEGLVVDWNPAAEKTFGYTHEEVIGQEMAGLIIPSRYREQHRQGLARCFTTGEGKMLGRRLELSADRRDGTEFPIELTITQIQTEGVMMFTGYVRDITERKKAEIRLAAQYAVTRALAESNTVSEGAAKILQAVCESLGWEYGSLWTVDRTSNALRCSQVWHALGTEADEFETVSRELVFKPGIGLPGAVWKDGQAAWIADVVKDPKFLRASSSAAKRGLHSAFAFPIRFRSEILGVVEFLSRSIREPDPDLLAMMGTIGSQIGQFMERKRVEEALDESEEQLRQSQKLEAIGQLAGGVAHDFNNLLTVIGGYASIMLGKLPGDSPHISSVEEIKKASDRASALTRQLLAFSRKQILQPKVLDLNVVVTDLEKMVRRLIGEDIDLLIITSAVLGNVKADPGQIEQVLLNLIVNARDAMPKGGKLTIETCNVAHSADYAQRHVSLPGPYVMLAVSDTGSGIDPAIQQRVFEPFFTTKGSAKGTGLGLATVYGIVKQSGGNIWIYSEVGRGSTFKVYLPRIDKLAEGEEAPSKEIPQGTETILLVEDEEQVRLILQRILEDRGYHVLAAADGEEAIAISQDQELEINLFITDVVMPHIGGRELAERITTFRPGLPVIFMSGYTDDAIVRHGLLDEKLSFIQKPFDSASVARKVREVLDSHSKGQQLWP